MSNYQGIKEEIRNYLVARVPLIVVDTAERERVISIPMIEQQTIDETVNRWLEWELDRRYTA